MQSATGQPSRETKRGSLHQTQGDSGGRKSLEFGTVRSPVSAHRSPPAQTTPQSVEPTVAAGAVLQESFRADPATIRRRRSLWP